MYGAGKRGEVSFNNIKIAGFSDRIISFVDDGDKDYHCGIPVIKLKDIKIKDNTAFLITTYAVSSMATNLMKMGVNAENIYFFPEILVDYIEESTLNGIKQEIEKTNDILNDDLSKYIFKSIFETYRTGNTGPLSRTMGSKQYFPIQGLLGEIPGFTLSKDEIFVDCGAYDGDTIKIFRDITNDKFKKIYAFEPEKENFLKLEAFINSSGIRDRACSFEGGYTMKAEF